MSGKPLVFGFKIHNTIQVYLLGVKRLMFLYTLLMFLLFIFGGEDNTPVLFYKMITCYFNRDQFCCVIELFNRPVIWRG